MLVLVDYDNLLPTLRSRGADECILKITELLVSSQSARDPLHFRLYGGWFEGPNLSRLAQTVSARLQREFPRVLPYTIDGTTSRLTIKAELALALAAIPGKYLTHTYRARAIPTNVSCAPPPFRGCRVPTSCPLIPLHNFLANGYCTTDGCSTSAADILTKPEQKLVDTTLAADLIHFAHESRSPIALVSSDDDFWPAILSALHLGATVLHIHTSPERGSPPHYKPAVNSSYTQASLSRI